MSPARFFELSAASYVPHALHGADRAFRETNCYADLWIEILHALGLDPVACLGFTLASDFEGDQWTFFKPPHADLQQLYGVEVEELTLWRPLIEQLRAQVARGRLPLCEVDSYYLPDTAGSDYRQQHTKTTIGIARIDLAAQHLGYFHNAGYFELRGDDLAGLLMPEIAKAEGYLPPFCEIVKCERARVLDPESLRAISVALARRHLARRPAGNPLQAYAAELPAHMALIADGGQPVFHAYSFAALRQLGACHELAAAYMRWLDRGSAGQLASAAECFTQLAEAAKMLIMKFARVASTRRPSDVSAVLLEMQRAWADGMQHAERGLSVDV